jgi:hypothetical protein
MHRWRTLIRPLFQLLVVCRLLDNVKDCDRELRISEGKRLRVRFSL